MNQTRESQPKVKKPYLPLVIGAAILALLITGGVLFQAANRAEPEAEVITVSTLERIVNVSELSTFTAVYNGVAEVFNEKKPDKIDYYVAYEARVKAGLDFEQIAISVDNESKEITITLPEIHITDIEVDISSMDFIFINEKANTSSVTGQAFKACEADVQQESEQQTAIYERAKQNAVNVLTALVDPLIEQLDDAYTLTIG